MILLTKNNLHVSCTVIKELPNYNVLLLVQDRLVIAGTVSPGKYFEKESLDLIGFIEGYL